MRCCLTLQLFHVQKTPPKSPKLFYAVRASWHPPELWSIHPIMEEHFSNHPSLPPPLPPPRLKLSPAAIETYRAAQNSRKSRQALEQMKVRWMTGGIRRMGGAAEGGHGRRTEIRHEEKVKCQPLSCEEATVYDLRSLSPGQRAERQASRRVFISLFQEKIWRKTLFFFFC